MNIFTQFAFKALLKTPQGKTIIVLTLLLLGLSLHPTFMSAMTMSNRVLRIIGLISAFV